MANPLNSFAPLHDVALINTTGSAGLSDEMKTFYDRMLLERTVPNLHHLKFGSVKRIPMNGGRVIEWRKFEALALSKTPLTEGELYTDLKSISVTAITGSVLQYGEAVGFSDIVTVVVAFCSGTITLAWLLRRASTQPRR